MSTTLRPAAGPLTFTRLKRISFTHSCIYTALLISAFVAGKPEPLTFVLGLTHGLLWIFMSLTCITAARLRVISLRTAVAVAVLGGIAPFFGATTSTAKGGCGRRRRTLRRGRCEDAHRLALRSREPPR